MPDADLTLMRRMDELHLEYPFAGARMLQGLLKAEGHEVGRLHIRALMRKMGIEALYRRSKISQMTLPMAPGDRNTQLSLILAAKLAGGDPVLRFSR